MKRILASVWPRIERMANDEDANDGGVSFDDSVFWKRRGTAKDYSVAQRTEKREPKHHLHRLVYLVVVMGRQQ